jgi:hypothetical protein
LFFRSVNHRLIIREVDYAKDLRVSATGRHTDGGRSGKQPSGNPNSRRTGTSAEATTAKGEQQNDVSMMRLFASDFVSAGRNVMSKQQLEAAVRSNFVSHGNGPSPVTIQKKNMVVYLFGDTAVVTLR